MVNFKRAVFALVLVGSLTGGVIPVRGQNMGGTVVEHRVNFPRGSNGTTKSGRAKYGMSYVYILGAASGQTMNINLTSTGNKVTFSLIAPNGETVGGAFGVRSWSGGLTQTGDYSIVAVMNDHHAGSVPYSLKMSIY